MANIINASERFKALQKNQELESLKKQFLEMFKDQPKHVFLEICKAILDGDKEKYFEITNPIMKRKAIKDFKHEKNV